MDKGKFLDDLADKVNVVFMVNGWRWGGVGSVDGLGEVPSVHEIRRTLGELWQQLGDDDATIETGRIRLEREVYPAHFEDQSDDFSVTAYLFMGDFSSGPGPEED